MSKLSIAMATYNGAQYLREQLNSIVNQTRKPDEMVICDDCSEDETIEIVKSFASRVLFPVHLIINDRRLGSTKNFEKAISHCSGDIIILADQDDVWHPTKLEKIEDVFMNDNNVGAVFTNALLVDEYLNSLGYTLWESIKFNNKEQDKIKNNKTIQVLLKHNVVTGATLAFRAKYRDLILPIPINWIHDGWIALLVAAVSNLALIQEPLILYRQHPKQQIGVRRKKLKDRLLEMIFSPKDYSINTKRVFMEYIDQYVSVIQRLKSSKYDIGEDVFKQLESKVEHVQLRAYINNIPKIRRIFLIIKELINFRYFYYSNGIYSALRDLLL